MAVGWSARPRERDRARLAEDRRKILEGPLLVDPSVVGDPIDVDGVPLDAAAGRRNAEQVAGMRRADDLSQRDEIAARDHVLLDSIDVRERADEPPEDRNDCVDAAHRSERATVQYDVCCEEVPRTFRVVTVEDPDNELASGGHTLVHLDRLAHAIASFVCCPVRDGGSEGWGIASRNSLVRHPSCDLRHDERNVIPDRGAASGIVRPATRARGAGAVAGGRAGW